MTGTASKKPTSGTPLSIVCRTVGGNPIIGVTIEVIGLRKKVSATAPNDPQHNGQNDHTITDDEIDATRAAGLASKPGMPEGECDVNVVAVAPAGMKLGAVSDPFVENGTVFTTIRLKKGSDQFARTSPLVLTMTTACMNQFVLDDKIPKKRVRNLTLEEAYQELIHHHKAGTVTVVPEPIFNDPCVPIVPKKNLPRSHTIDGPLNSKGKPTRVTVPSNGPNGGRLSIDTELVHLDPRVDQVKLFYNGHGIRGGEVSRADILNVNPVNAVGLVRLCQRLSVRFGIKELHHAGCGRNVVVGTGDCHDYGRAIDFVGAKVANPVKGKPDLLLTVEDDWTTETVPAHAEIGERPSEEARRRAWDEIKTPIEYRFLSLNLGFESGGDKKEQARVVQRALDDKRISPALIKAFNAVNAKKNPAEEDLKAVRDPLLAERDAYVTLSRTFFQFIYDWAADNYSFASETADPSDDQAPDFPGNFGPPSPAKEMGKGGFIMHPDHFASATDASGREAHHGHYHIQIGPTHGATGREPVIKKDDVPKE
ncbi:hypothetical protein BH10PSE17_BH10PSE17_26880 [soil metagenome]